MKARMTSRVTAMPKLERIDESPAKGRRQGTRARAAAKCAASSDTSNATIGAGAVCTSGRFPIAMSVRLPQAGHNVNTASIFGRWRIWDRGAATVMSGRRGKRGRPWAGLRPSSVRPRTTVSPAERSVAAAAPPDRLHPGTATVILLVLVGAGTAMRVQGLTTLGFYRDDAWAALSSRVGIGTAWHMWLAAPGFYFLERSFIELHPQSTWWAQLPELAAGIAAIPAIYLLARHFGFRRVVGLVLACIVTVSPVCVVYSTRVKEYSTVFLVSVAVLWAAETARRRLDRTRLAVLAALSVAGFAISASLGPVIAGVWIASGICVLRDDRHRRDVIVSGESPPRCAGSWRRSSTALSRPR